MAGPGALFQIGCRRETIGRSACLEEGAPVSPGSTSSLRAFFELELRRTYAHPVAISQHVLADALAVYVDTVLAAPVNDARVVVFRDDYGVSPADVLSLELYIVVHRAPDRQLVIAARHLSDAGIIHPGDQRCHARADRLDHLFLTRSRRHR